MFARKRLKKVGGRIFNAVDLAIDIMGMLFSDRIGTKPFVASGFIP
jgi:hypothetical protein